MEGSNTPAPEAATTRSRGWSLAAVALSVLVVASIAVLLALAELDGYLAQLQHEGHGSYTMNDLAPFNPAKLTTTVEGLLAIWDRGGDAAAAATTWHLLLDSFVFIPAYAILLSALLFWTKRSVPATRRNEGLLAVAARWPILVVGLVATDLSENGWRMRIVWEDDASWLPVHAAWLSTWLKWTFLTLTLAMLAALAVRAAADKLPRSDDREASGTTRTLGKPGRMPSGGCASRSR